MNMFKLFLIVSAVLMICAQQVDAKIWKVDNNAGSTIKDFTKFQEAHDGAAAGDTLYILGSPASYGALVMTKKLIIIGNGYFLGENQGLQVNKSGSIADVVTINTGAQGTIITSIITNNIDINTSNITIRRCYIYNSSTTIKAAVDLAASIGNITIAQNYIVNNYSSYSSTGFCCLIADNCSNIIIANNMMTHIMNTIGYSISSGNSSIRAINNLLYGPLQANNSEFTNNIQRSSETFSGSNNSYSYNISSSTQFGSANGNQSSVNMTSVFVTSGTSDSKYKLADASPAKGAGLNGTDIGMFGGSNPYILSGIPPIPTIYQLDVPLSGSSTGGLKVQLRAKTNK